MECVGKRSATPLFPLLSFAGTHGSPSAQCTRNDSCGKRRRRFALPAQSKMRLATHNDAIVRVIYSRLNYRQNAGSAGDK